MYPLRRGPEQLEGPLIPSPPQISCFLIIWFFWPQWCWRYVNWPSASPRLTLGFSAKAAKNPVVRREPRSQGYSYSLLNGEPRSYLEFPNHLIVSLWVTSLSPFISGYNACIDDCVMGRTQDVGSSFGCWELRKHHHSKILKKVQ